VRVGNILAKSFWAWLIFSLKDTWWPPLVHVKS
jgi:hypothetical protein